MCRGARNPPQHIAAPSLFFVRVRTFFRTYAFRLLLMKVWCTPHNHNLISFALILDRRITALVEHRSQKPPEHSGAPGRKSSQILLQTQKPLIARPDYLVTVLPRFPSYNHSKVPHSPVYFIRVQGIGFGVYRALTPLNTGRQCTTPF